MGRLLEGRVLKYVGIRPVIRKFRLLYLLSRRRHLRASPHFSVELSVHARIITIIHYEVPFSRKGSAGPPKVDSSASRARLSSRAGSALTTYMSCHACITTLPFGLLRTIEAGMHAAGPCARSKNAGTNDGIWDGQVISSVVMLYVYDLIIVHSPSSLLYRSTSPLSKKVRGKAETPQRPSLTAKSSQ